MPKLMRPLTFGCESGFREVFYDSENPVDDSRQDNGNAFCYHARLDDDEKKDAEVMSKCMAMKAGECWKIR